MSKSLRYDAVRKSFRSDFRKPGLIAHFFSRHANDRRVILDDFSATISAGEKVLLVGPNGSGKSTILKLAMGLYEAEAGAVTIEGIPVNRTPRGLVGAMLSTRLLYGSLSGYQNLALSANLYGCRDVSRRVKEAVQRWGLSEFIHQPVDVYSNGMKSVLALARATIHDPELILLDEPTNFLDDANARRLASFLKDTRQTVIVTGQDDVKLGPCVDRSIRIGS